MNYNIIVADKNESEMVNWEELPFHSESSHSISSNQPYDQMSSMNHNIATANKNEFEMLDWEELPFHHESNHCMSCNQPKDQVKKDDVIIDLEAMIQNSEDGLLSSTCCIYKVPHVIRKLKPEAYTPKAVSIGPFHYGNVRLQNMERHKQIFFKRFKRRVKTSLDDLVNFAKQLEPSVRACYSENIRLGKKELVKVILVDACFIIELFKSYYKKGRLKSDAKFSKPWLSNIVRLDLLLLENQLPFFFLEELFNKAFPLNLRGDVPSFRKLTYAYFAYYNKQNLKPNPNARIEHFTDLLRFFHLQTEEHQRMPFGEAGSNILLYSVSQLSEAGVKFKVSASKCLLNLKFTGRVLEIPHVLVAERTETLFRNMIALEQCHYPFHAYIIDYALILDWLINTSKDVNVLVHEEIIRIWIGDSNDVVKLFNGLGKNIVQSNFNSNYLDICKSLNGFYKDPWHNLMATLRRDYCKTPWQMAGSVAAIVLLILSLIQAIFSILDYTK